jgi:hypothetical protein
METKTKKKQNQLDKLKQQRDALNARIQAAEARGRVSERKQDTRRKILIGAYYLDQAQQNPDQWSQLVKIMADYLTRDSDRRLFGLPSLTTPSEKVIAS